VPLRSIRAKSGPRIGNLQLESRQGDKVRSSPRCGKALEKPGRRRSGN
jgi:hypothetical protein